MVIGFHQLIKIKFKYYARCPNRGYNLNDERDINMLHRNLLSEKNQILGNRKTNYGNYEKKIILN